MSNLFGIEQGRAEGVAAFLPWLIKGLIYLAPEEITLLRTCWMGAPGDKSRRTDCHQGVSHDALCSRTGDKTSSYPQPPVFDRSGAIVSAAILVSHAPGRADRPGKNPWAAAIWEPES